MVIKHFLIGSIGTNCYLVWDEACSDAFLIDPAQNIPQIAQTIHEEFLNLKYVILTHGHGDHIGGVPAVLAEFPEAKLAAGRYETQLLAQARINYSLEIIGQSISLTPDVLLADGDVLTVGDMNLEILETPGHTPGGISILVNKEVLFAGDTLFRESIGRTDLAGGDYETLLRSIREKLFTLPDEIQVYPGHMTETTIGHEKQFNPYV